MFWIRFFFYIIHRVTPALRTLSVRKKCYKIFDFNPNYCDFLKLHIFADFWSTVCPSRFYVDRELGGLLRFFLDITYVDEEEIIWKSSTYIQSTVDSFSYFMVWREQKKIYSIRRDAGCFRGHKSWVPCYCTNQRGLNGKAIKFGSS